MRRRSSVIMFGDPQGEMYSISRRRLLPHPRLRWSRWCKRRANLRRRAEYAAIGSEIRIWLDGLLGADGSVVSSELDPAEAELMLTVDFDGRRQQLTFSFY